jgi:hypothetical protein
MARLPPYAMRWSRLDANLSVEDRRTRRRWIQGCCLFYSAVIALLLAIGALNRPPGDSMASAGDYAGKAVERPETRPQLRAPAVSQVTHNRSR